MSRSPFVPSVAVAACLSWLTMTITWLACAADPAYRTWTDATGKFSVEAALIEVKQSKAALKKPDGTVVSVPLRVLSEADQRFVREELRRRKESAAKRDDRRGAASNAGEWPQWRGPNRDGVCQETSLLQQWPQEGPPLIYNVPGLGKGYSSVAVAGGKIFTIGHKEGGESLIALDAESGRLLWSRPFSRAGEPNGTPTVDGDLVYAVGRDGDIVCCRVETGEVQWKKSFAADFGGKMMSGWGYSESPLIDGDRLICTPGGSEAILAALDKKTGQTIWTAAMPAGARRGKDGAGYSSVVTSNAAGIKQYVQLVGRGVISVSADDGRFLWGYDEIANTTANIPTPIIDDNFVFCSTGYNDGGSALLSISRSGASLDAREVYYKAPCEFQNHHGGMIQLGDYIYAGAGHNRGFPICIEMKSGAVKWGGNIRGPGAGSAAIVYADGNLIFRYEDGVVALIEATPEEYRLKSTFQPVYQQGKSWAHPVVSGGRLYLREQDRLMSYDLRQRP